VNHFCLDHDALDLIEADLIAPAIVELGPERFAPAPAAGDRKRGDSGTDGSQTCMGLFLSSDCFWVFLTVLCSERERPFFVPSPAIRFPERAEGVKGPKR
jgi:hypothetical protein